VNEHNERSFWMRARAIFSISDPRWGRNEGNGNAQRPNDPNRPRGNGNGDSPPDLDEMWRDFNRRLSRFFGGKRQGSGPGERRPDNGRAARVGVGIVIGVLLAIYIGSGVFVVQEGQTGVVLQFGKYRRTVGPGIHVRSPFPFETDEIVNVSEVRSIEIGRKNAVNDGNTDASMLTHDGDIVDVRFAVRYQVKSPVDYLFRAADPDRSVTQAAQAAVRELVGARSTDELLGQNNDAFGQQLGAAIQHSLERNQTGLTVVGVTVESIAPPQQIQAAFADAAHAKDDRERAKREAQAYAGELLPRAQADASRVIDDAKAYADRVIAQAQGDAERFEQVYAQYSRAPAVVRERLYLDTMRDIYSNTTKVFIGNKGGGAVVTLPLDKLVEAGRQSASEAAAASAAPGSAPQAAAPVAPASPASASPAAAASEPVRSRDTLRSRSREDDLQQ
jgi:modulator of FtsH protease HflK